MKMMVAVALHVFNNSRGHNSHLQG